MQQSVIPPAFVYWPRLRAFLMLWRDTLWGFSRNTYQDWLSICENDYAAAMIIHKIKTEWIFSGVRQDQKGYFSDIGITRSTKKLNRAQALREYNKMFPKGVIKHLDDANKIITYAVTG